MKISAIREFIVFSEYMNISRAAKHLFITQSALSNHIASIEKEVGCALVIRDGAMRLTAAGKAFLGDAIDLVQRYDAMVAKCNQMKDLSRYAFAVEAPASLTIVNQLFEMAMTSFTVARPNADVSIVEPYGRAPLERLLEGEVDVSAVFSLQAVERIAGSERIRHARFPRDALGRCYLWMDGSHPLAKRDRLTLEDLDGTCHVTVRDASYRIYEDWVKSMAGKAGARVCFNYRMGLRLAALFPFDAQEVAICWEQDKDIPLLLSQKERVFVPLEDDRMELSLYFLWLADNENPNLAEFVSHLECG